MNKHLFTELDQLQVSLLKVSQNGGDHSSSNPNLAALNPFLSHLSHLRSVYE
jgi:beta-lactamase superfamily II metal-dependent hydrolase